MEYRDALLSSSAENVNFSLMHFMYRLLAIVIFFQGIGQTCFALSGGVPVPYFFFLLVEVFQNERSSRERDCSGGMCYYCSAKLMFAGYSLGKWVLDAKC